ncbi:hypothetical protein XENTR_v10000541 [Xenopus tropicalis]|nr:uncharacterized protein LOC100487667 isoform X2 [Xenopus tropicalis]KAE8629602.1 hypothetical protein XENTR_v10000541 [Xenopus tropicalis]|eukprot:XP_012811130.1 PREDICTED: uncharacterized protein LOC100487667 [Xenopus tropicalis]
MLLTLKRYIGRNKVVEWALFHLQMQIHSRSDLLFNISSFSKNNTRKDFEKLKNLLCVHPQHRTQQVLRQIQSCLKKNRAFQSLRDKTQLQLCQHAVYQEYEAKTLVIRQGHKPIECYLILSGTLMAVTENGNAKKQSALTDELYEVEEGDFVGEIGLVTNKRPTSFICKTHVEVLVIDKEAFKDVLAAKVQEQYYSLCDFLRNVPLFSSWPSEKIDLLVHCSLQRNYRAGTTVIVNSLTSGFLVLIKSGKCLIALQLTPERMLPDSGATRNYSALLKRFPTMPLILEKRNGSAYPFERLALPRAPFSASYRATSNQVHTRARPQTAGPLTFSLQERTERCDLDYKDKKQTEEDGCTLQHATASPAGRFITVGTLEHGGVFGLAETIFMSSGLRFSLISEGAECILIPTKLFLLEAPAKSKQIAQELVNTFPTEKTIRENYERHKMWTAYKDKIIGQQLTRGQKSLFRK